MKKHLLLLTVFAFIAMTSCVKEHELSVPEIDKEEALAILDTYTMTELFEVPTEVGMKTIVKYGDVTLYEGNLPMDIQVPVISASGTTTRETPIDYGMEPDWDYTGTNDLKHAVVRRSGILMFEDEYNNSDNDYNDIVCGIAEKMIITQSNSNSKEYNVIAEITCYPMAMGNKLSIPTFGIEFYSKEHRYKTLYLSNPTGRSFKENFGISDPFTLVNTDTNGGGAIVQKSVIRSFQVTTSFTVSVDNDNKLYIFPAYYISRSNHNDPYEGIYALDASTYESFKNGSIKLASVISSQDMPLGLFIPDSNITETSCRPSYSWPLERVSISDAYPEFYNWRSGKTGNPFREAKEKLLFPKSIIGF